MESHKGLRLVRCPRGHVVGILCPHCRTGLLRNERTTSASAEAVCDSCGSKHSVPNVI
jgi:predicted RNA-binding Zn-ribbon protein involved in translation (DUF1610 family)